MQEVVSGSDQHQLALPASLTSTVQGSHAVVLGTQPTFSAAQHRQLGGCGEHGGRVQEWGAWPAQVCLAGERHPVGRWDVLGEEQGTVCVPAREARTETSFGAGARLGQAALSLGQQEVPEEPLGQFSPVVLGSKFGTRGCRVPGLGNLLSVSAG